MDIKIDSQLMQIILTYGNFGLFILILFFLLYNWDKVEKFVSSLTSFSVGIFKSRESLALRLSLQAELNNAIAELDKEVPGLFEKSISVKWLESGEEHINASRKGFFIRVTKTENTDILFLKSLDFLLNNALLVNSRSYIHGHILEGVKLVLGEKMISKAGLYSALITYRSQKYNPLITKDKSIAKATNQLEFLDYQGLFTRVFLRECIELHLRTGVGHEASRPKWDIARFLDFASELFRTLGREGIRANFEYSSATLNIAFAVLADEFTWAISGLDFYKKRTRLSIERGAKTIYIVGLGARNIKLASNLGTWLETQGFLGQKSISYYNLSFGKRNNVSALCVRCEIQPQAKNIITEKEILSDPEIVINDEKLHQIVKSVVQDSDIDIIKSAWLKGYQAQIVINSKNSNKKPLWICIGKEAVTAKEISRLAGDYVRFIEWSPDLRVAIRNNLDNHKHEEVTDITFEPTSRFAYLSVQSAKTVRDLIGKDGKTLKLAEALTEYSIEIQIDPKSEIIDMLKETIPEIASGEINVLNIAILQGYEIRILVSSDMYDSPAMICGGYMEDIRSKYCAQEWLYFCNKKDNLPDAIVASLYPLRSEDVFNVLQDTPSQFTVVVKEKEAMARGIGTDGAHVRTASSLLGVRIRLATPEDVKK